MFKDDFDRRQFLEIVRKEGHKSRVAIHGYVLMTTHFHLLVTGYEVQSLPRMMQSLGRRYVRYFNDRHQRTGTLWEGRYWASLIANERYWLTCLRYIEMNPLAARLVTSPEGYAWSSYQGNALGRLDTLLTPHPCYLQLGPDAESRATSWLALCGQPVCEADRAKIRMAIRRGLPLDTNRVEDLPESLAS